MARPRHRTGSKNGQLKKRIPLDVLKAVRSLGVLDMPIGPEKVPHRISPTTTHIALSLRTADKSEIITRNAAALAYLENVFSALGIATLNLSSALTWVLRLSLIPVYALSHPPTGRHFFCQRFNFLPRQYKLSFSYWHIFTPKGDHDD